MPGALPCLHERYLESSRDKQGNYLAGVEIAYRQTGARFTASHAASFRGSLPGAAL